MEDRDDVLEALPELAALEALEVAVRETLLEVPLIFRYPSRKGK